jgi:glycosylphosphatidylinositol transamidase (GPIT) subunit GPI8
MSKKVQRFREILGLVDRCCISALVFVKIMMLNVLACLFLQLQQSRTSKQQSVTNLACVELKKVDGHWRFRLGVHISYQRKYPLNFSQICL